MTHAPLNPHPSISEPSAKGRWEAASLAAQRGLGWYGLRIRQAAQGRAPRLKSVAAFALVMLLGLCLLLLSKNSVLVTAFVWLLSIPVGVTGMLIIDLAPRRDRAFVPRWLWPPQLSWAPVFRRQLWPPLIFGVTLSGLVWLTTPASGEKNSRGSIIETAIVMVVLVVAQVIYLGACSRAFREDKSLGEGRPRKAIVLIIMGAIWVLAAILPMGGALALRLQQQDLVLFVVLTGPALLCLGVMCRGLQAWEQHPSVRHDVSAFAIQSAVVVLILWVVFAFDAILRCFAVTEPSLLEEILRTLLYASTFLLLPAAWWTHHVIRSAEH